MIEGQQEIIIKNQPDCILPKSFFEGRFPPRVHPDSLDWDQWWDDQILRCLNGWSDGGHSITGPYYYHLNIKSINMLDSNGKPTFDHPYFAYEDQQLFNDIHKARDAGKGLMLITGRGFGKSTDPDTPLIMHNGSIKKAKHICIGDTLMGDDSTSRKVLSVTEGKYDMYEIIPKKGESHKVNGRHILALYYNHQYGSKKYGWAAKSYVTMSIEDYLAASDNIKSHLTLYRRGWGDEFPKLKNPELPPYMLGLYLGDRTQLNGDITNPDVEIRNYIHSYANSIGYKVTYNKMGMKITKGLGAIKNIYTQKLISLNVLNNKHIPEKYLISDRKTRLELLAGLLDTDGYLEPVCKNTFEIIQKNKILADQIVYLARSLNFYVNVKTKEATLKRENHNIYRCDVQRIIISGDTELIPTKVLRKQAISRKQIKNHQHTGFSIKALGHGDYVSIETNKNHLFLLGDGTVTHNSFSAATIAEYEFVFREASECIISASTDFFASQLWSKVELGLNSIHPELRPNFLRKKIDYRESGFSFKDDEGIETMIGYLSKLHKVTYDNDAGKTRGTRPNVHIFEEVGSWSGAAKLSDCYNMTEASWWRGIHFTCFPLLIGTGGQMKQGGSVDAKIMFHDPDAFNLLAFEYSGKKVAKFVQAYRKFEGFYEKSGICDEVAAKEFLDNRRESKKSNIKNFQQEIQEFPYEPSEAFMLSGTNVLPTDIMYDRYSELTKNAELGNIVRQGRLEFIDKNDIFKGVEFILDAKGDVFILEDPYYNDSGVIPENLYISGCDSYDAVEESSDDGDGKSRGSIFMYKRFWKLSITGNMFVAKITQRPDDAEDFYWNTVKLNMFYGSKMLYEHTKIGIARHYITNKLARMYLYAKPDLVSLGVLKKTKTTNRYGVTMPVEVKRYIIQQYGTWIKKYIHTMFFKSQLEDGINFVFGSSAFDETMAAAIAVLGDEDMFRVKIKEDEKEKSKAFPKFRRNAQGRMIFG